MEDFLLNMKETTPKQYAIPNIYGHVKQDKAITEADKTLL